MSYPSRQLHIRISLPPLRRQATEGLAIASPSVYRVPTADGGVKNWRPSDQVRERRHDLSIVSSLTVWDSSFAYKGADVSFKRSITFTYYHYSQLIQSKVIVPNTIKLLLLNTLLRKHLLHYTSPWLKLSDSSRV
jgi:hypothetical protein